MSRYWERWEQQGASMWGTLWEPCGNHVALHGRLRRSRIWWWVWSRRLKDFCTVMVSNPRIIAMLQISWKNIPNVSFSEIFVLSFALSNGSCRHCQFNCVLEGSFFFASRDCGGFSASCEAGCPRPIRQYHLSTVPRCACGTVRVKNLVQVLSWWVFLPHNLIGILPPSCIVKSVKVRASEFTGV